MASNWHQIGSKNPLKMEYPIGLGDPKCGTPSASGAKKMKKIDYKKQRNKKQGGVPQRPPILTENVTNMASSWLTKSIKNQ